MNCHLCNKELNNYSFLSLKEYKLPLRFPTEDSDLIASFEFCSEDCAQKFKSTWVEKGFIRLYEIDRCIGYYDCKRLGNLRRKCEREEVFGGGQLEFGNGPSKVYIPRLPPIPFCEAAEVAIIRANLKLFDLFEKFDESSSKINKEMLIHTKNMSRLTKWILGLTIANAIFVVVQIILVLNK